ncbi:hypothetical protein FG93_04604 [Bosea sp. LC85]|nr:hypothetical protein FG93_04604 [Bosea sp. LC85]
MNAVMGAANREREQAGATAEHPGLSRLADR